ncbi:MAG: hypothetical protein K940chlam3_00960 [Chlamydiae bacterium]|nr:hypothetical protein [Chlamydiota bacterium]
MSNLWEINLQNSISDLEKKNIDDCAKNFNDAIKELSTVIDKHNSNVELVRVELISLLCALYELDCKINKNIGFRKKIFTSDLDELILKSPSPYSDFLEVMKVNPMDSESRIQILEKFNYKYPDDVGVTCCRAYALTMCGQSKSNEEDLMKAKELYDSCGSAISNINWISTNRINLICNIADKFYINGKCNEIENLIKEAVYSDWILQTGLTSHLVTLDKIYRTSGLIQADFDQRLKNMQSKIEEKIASQDSRLIEILVIFVTILAIVAGAFSTFNSNASFLEKKLFISALTLAMLGSLCVVILLLSSTSTKKWISGIVAVLCAGIFYIL